MIEGNPFVVQGFEIPTDNPFFLTTLSIHILTALTCVLTGIFAMLSKKQIGLHPNSGTIYFWSLFIVFITVTIMAVMRLKEDYHLLILGFISFGSAWIGRKARKNKWKKWSIIHISAMGNSYIFLLIAFYTDNGKFLPLWKNLNPIFYWLLPSIVGFPILIRTLFRHPLSRKYFERS